MKTTADWLLPHLRKVAQPGRSFSIVGFGRRLGRPLHIVEATLSAASLAVRDARDPSGVTWRWGQ